MALGWDAFLEFARWQQSPEILRLAGLILFDRAGKDSAGKEEPGELTEMLPAPWGEDAAWDGRSRLIGQDGRVLLRRISITLPRVSAREILRSRSLDGVPPGAREVLEEYWRRG